MNTPQQPAIVAAVCQQGSPDAPAMKTYLASHGVDQAQWTAPDDVHDVDRDVRAGTIRRVVFLRPDDLLTALWDQAIAAEQWLHAEVRVEFVESPGEHADPFVTATLESWSAWQRRQRRRQVTAGVVLSAAALALAFILVQLGT